MFWPFQKWPTAPAPYDQRASAWNIPARLAALPFDLLRTSSYPSRPGVFLPALAQRNDPQPTFFLPRKPDSAHSGVARSAAVAMTRESARIADISRRALVSSAGGVAVSYDEAVAMLQARLPQGLEPAQVRKPTGIYSVPRAPNPPCAAAQIAKLLPQGIGPERSMVSSVVAKVAAQPKIPTVARAMMRGR